MKSDGWMGPQGLCVVGLAFWNLLRATADVCRLTRELACSFALNAVSALHPRLVFVVCAH